MQIEISDPSFMDSLRGYLQGHGCPSEPTGPDTFEVRVLRSTDEPLTDTQVRAKVFGHLREWCAANAGVKANLLS